MLYGKYDCSNYRLSSRMTWYETKDPQTIRVDSGYFTSLRYVDEDGKVYDEFGRVVDRLVKG